MYSKVKNLIRQYWKGRNWFSKRGAGDVYT